MLPGSTYIIQSSMHDLGDSKTGRVGNRTGRNNNKTMCTLAISSMQGLTGDMWILGQPFFFEYNIGYDLSTTPPSMSFTSTREVPCGSCDHTAGLVATGVSPARTGRPRVLSGLPRMPSFDVTQ